MGTTVVTDGIDVLEMFETDDGRTLKEMMRY